MTELAAALKYAADGWPVFPCKPGSKEPATLHGFKDATTDPALITAWWTRMPTANVAIATGAPGPDVLDVDVKPDGDGFAAFNRLKRAGMLVGASVLVATRNGGLHAYFVGTGQPCGRLPKLHLDFKATGGYVLAPPSTVAADEWATRGTGRYDLLDRRPAAGRLDWSAVVGLLAPPSLTAWAPRGYTARARSIGALADWVASQAEGNRNQALYWAARRAMKDDESADLAPLVTAAVVAGLTEAEAERTVASARDRGPWTVNP